MTFGEKRKICMTISSINKQGEIWLAKFQFDDTLEVKIRPIVIMGNEKATDNISVITCPISTSRPRNEFDVEIVNWESLGLRKKSVIRTSKIKPIMKQLLLKKIGHLPLDLL